MYSRAASGVQRCLRSIRPRFHDIGRRNENMIANLDWAIVHPFCDDCLMLREWVFEVAFARVIYPVHPPRDRAPATVGTSTPASSTTVTIIRASMTPGSCIFLRADRCVGSHPTFWLVGASHFMYCHNDCLAIARADLDASLDFKPGAVLRLRVDPCNPPSFVKHVEEKAGPNITWFEILQPLHSSSRQVCGQPSYILACRRVAFHVLPRRLLGDRSCRLGADLDAMAQARLVCCITLLPHNVAELLGRGEPRVCHHWTDRFRDSEVKGLE